MLTLPSLVLLLFAVFSSAAGQIMLKHGMRVAAKAADHAGGSLAIRAATTPWVVLGLAVFGISAVAWMSTLAQVPLSIAYPFNALGYLLIVLASSTVLHEQTSPWTWAGSLLVVVGLVTVFAGQSA
jgi:multidrug transporter EmrE-like cation transporter